MGIPRDHNCRTELASSIKAKITELENAAMEYAFVGSADVEDREAILQAAQVARYNLERTILTLLKEPV